MKEPLSAFQESLRAGKRVILAEVMPPTGADPATIRRLVKGFAGHVAALGMSDNRDEVRVSALAASVLALQEGVEPILHMTTRDRNRIGLLSDFLGASTLGVRSFLCTGGTHQTLGKFRNAKNVYDIDPVQFMRMILGGSGPEACVGGVVNPFADPLDLQLMLTAKKISAGAEFLVTHPVFDTKRFGEWWIKVTEAGLEKKTAFVAGVRVLASAEEACAHAAEPPLPVLPSGLIERLGARKGARAQRDEGIAIALETVEYLSTLKGLMGFEISCNSDRDAALEVIKGIQDA
jgi:5,10-methylenetetrahydrofolate reductase